MSVSKPQSPNDTISTAMVGGYPPSSIPVISATQGNGKSFYIPPTELDRVMFKCYNYMQLCKMINIFDRFDIKHSWSIKDREYPLYLNVKGVWSATLSATLGIPVADREYYINLYHDSNDRSIFPTNYRIIDFFKR